MLPTSPTQKKPPLDRFPLIDTGRVDEFRAGITHLFSDSTFDVSVDRKSHENFGARVNFRRSSDVGVMYAYYGSQIRARFSDVRFYVQGIPLKGAGEQATAGQPHAVGDMTGGVLSPDTRIGLTFSPGFRHFALLFDPRAVMSKLTAITGRVVPRPPRFTGRTDFQSPAAARLRELTSVLATRLGDDAPIPMFIEDTEQRAISLFLFANDHEYRREFDIEPPTIATSLVRRAEEYIEANWDRHITIESLSAVSGCSVRSLFHQFRRGRGYSPMQFLRQVRLCRARDMLSRPNHATSVTDVALACGFGNFGHFAGYYRSEFGELPSDALHRARRRAGHR